MDEERQSIEIEVHESWPELVVHGTEPALSEVMEDVGGPPPRGKGAVTYSWAVGAGEPFKARAARISQIKAAAEARGVDVSERPSRP